MNEQSTGSTKRRLRLCYWNADARHLDASKLALEERLALLGEFTIDRLANLTDLGATPADLLVIAAPVLEGEPLMAWLERTADSLRRQAGIYVPALILADLDFQALRGLLEKARGMNWYFDIIAPGSLDSLPLRVANLLRIHDHLHEVARYDRVVGELTHRVEALVKKLPHLTRNRGESG